MKSIVMRVGIIMAFPAFASLCAAQAVPEVQEFEMTELVGALHDIQQDWSDFYQEIVHAASKSDFIEWYLRMPSRLWPTIQDVVYDEYFEAFKRLPEGFLKMLLRRVYYQRTGRLLDVVNIGYILQKFENAYRCKDGCAGLSWAASLHICNLPMVDHSYDIEGLMGLIREFDAINPVSYLDLSACYLKKVPEGIGKLQKLKILCLHKNDLKVLPAGIVGLIGLEALYIDGNSNLKSLPQGLENLVNLKHFYIDRKLVSLIPLKWSTHTTIYLFGLMLPVYQEGLAVI